MPWLTPSSVVFMLKTYRLGWQLTFDHHARAAHVRVRRNPVALLRRTVRSSPLPFLFCAKFRSCHGDAFLKVS